MEIASHIELTQDPFPKGTPGVKAPETPKGHPGLNFFQSWPQYSIESVSRAPGPLKSWIYSSLSTPCRSTLSQGSSKMKCSRNFQSIKHYLHGAGERSRNAGGDAVKGVFTMPKHDGLFANKGESLGLPSVSRLRLWWIRPTGSFFCRVSGQAGKLKRCAISILTFTTPWNKQLKKKKKNNKLFKHVWSEST